MNTRSFFPLKEQITASVSDIKNPKNQKTTSIVELNPK